MTKEAPNELHNTETIPLVFELKDGKIYEKIDQSGILTEVVTQIDGEKFNEYWFKIMTTK